MAAKALGLRMIPRLVRENSRTCGVDEREREQIGLIVTHDLALFSREIEQELGAIYASHSAAGRLQSGATIKVSVAKMHDTAETFLSDLASKTKLVTAGADAFEILRTAVLDCLNACGAQMPQIVRMAKVGRVSSEPDSIEMAAMKLFAGLRSDVEAKLEIQRFDFERAGAPEPAVAVAAKDSAKAGGRPPASFWDDLWAATAAALYDGRLAPKTQADIEKAMADWLESRRHSAATSTVRARARRLWDAIASRGE